MLAAGVIEPVDHSDWATPLVIARKADGGIRVCADYKITLNKVLLVDRYPVPKIEDLFTNLSNNSYFTKLDLSHAYNQYELDEASKCYTVINTHRGLFKYNRLVYGLSSSPGIFQKMMQSVLQGIPNVLNFLDDILITGADLDDHLKTINEVFSRLESCGLKLKKSKCVFLADKVTFLGFKVDKRGVSVDPEKIKPILEMSAPKNVAELRSFLGMVNFYGKFVRNLSSYLYPLYQLVKKGVHWRWGKEEEAAFRQVKRLLCSTDVLVHFDISQQSVVTCDASAHGLGAVLAMRGPDGTERVVAYASRSLTAHELHYSQIHKEALAIVFAVSKFHQYLYGRKFTLRTDHKPLVSIFGPNCGVPVTAASRLQRWAIVLSAYDFDIEYVSTEKNTADALSRLIKSHKDEMGEEAGQIPEQTYLHFAADALLLDYNKLKTSTASDPILGRVLGYIKNGWPSECEIRELNPYFNRKDELYTELGCVLWGHRVVIPISCREKVLRELHEPHMGIVKTKSLARGYVWWPGVDEAIEARCRECGVCAAASSAPPAHAPRLWAWPDRPWTRIHLDFLGPIRGKTYLIIVDAYSKWIEAIGMSSTSAAAVIRVLRELWSRFGIPKQVVSDNGPPYTSSEFKKFLSVNGVDQVLSAPYHPASNGAAESAVKICKAVILKSFKENVDAETALCRFLLQYRNTEHSTTGESPARLLQGRSLRNRLDCLRPDRSDHVRAAQERQRRAAGGVERELRAGDPVWVRQYRGNDKWLPGMVRDRRGDTDYIVDTSNGTGVHRHIDQLKNRRVSLNNGGGNVAKRNSLIFPGNDDSVPQPDVEEPGAMGSPSTSGDHERECSAEPVGVASAASPSAHTAVPCTGGSPNISPDPSSVHLPPDSPVKELRVPRIRKPPFRFGFEDLFVISNK
ncbi:uncharacterized protein K02A2.6-like isoform X1 [Leguminivora glycinivorella]|uniref:uncharacterized protein K02A2.6-like isoform X1 n=1 Tax=Leguminivora glycinivorella TaxID=1035111 RepID=UPI00200BFBCC|nr:uncharacterized protein K02A2.6-like isoform X1 [Leguminivora glycinivorella]